MTRRTVANLSADLASGRTTSRFLVEEALQRIRDDNGEGSRVFAKVYIDSALEQADAADHRRSVGAVRSIVDGLPISVKDLFDVAGDVTLAGSKVLAGAPPAQRDAVAVERLRSAGAIIIGRTTMVEFAYGGIGMNPHFGTPRNPFQRSFGGRIPGGSSSGAAVAVADSMCLMALGSDTGGSVRLPAALCGVTAFKPTASRMPREGVFPLSSTLDTVGTLTNSVACCFVYDSILAGEDLCSVRLPSPATCPGLRLVVPQSKLLHNMDPFVSTAFDRTVDLLRAAGACVQTVDAPVLSAAMDMSENGCIITAFEAYELHRPLLAEHRGDYDPHIARRLDLGRSVSAGDYIQRSFDRQRVIAEASNLLSPFDAMIYPTVPVIAPEIASIPSGEEFSKLNLFILRNTRLINFLNGCAVTVPCHSSGEPPVGFTIAGLSGSDKHILEVAMAVESLLLRGL